MLKRWLRFFILLFIIICPCLSAQAQEEKSFRLNKISRDPALQNELEKIVRIGLKKAFQKPTEALAAPSVFFERPLPIFVTLRNAHGEVRGCMGSLYPTENSLSSEIVRKIEWALFKDPRHRPVKIEEIQGIEVFITEVSTPIPIRSISQISPARDGVYLRQGSREAVLLPGEAKTQRYLLALLKAKAGVLPHQPFQLYRLKSLSILVKIEKL